MREVLRNPKDSYIMKRTPPGLGPARQYAGFAHWKDEG